jgi:uncharacterized membrane protein
MTKRMAIAAMAFAGIFLATYLTLYKLGIIGQLACTVGECETVNLSRWARLLGLPVAAWGIGFYIVLFAVAMAGVSERHGGARWIPTALLVLTGWGVVFSAWLTYLELFVIRAICLYCVVSAVLVTMAFVVSLLDWRERRARPMEA